MTDRSGGRPWGLLVVLVGTLLASAALLAPGVPRPIEWVAAVGLLVVFPGAALVAAFVPARGPDDQPGTALRVGLTVGGSALVVGVVGAGLAAVEVLTLTTAVVALAAIVTLGTLVGAVRWRRSGLAILDWPASRADVHDRLGLSTLQTVVLAVAALALLGTLGVAAMPASGGSYSEVSLLDTDERLLGPGALAVDGSTTLLVRIDNHEGHTVTYHVVGQRQRVGPDGAVGDPQEIDRFEVSIDDDTVALAERPIDAPAERSQLRYLVYEGSVPAEPDASNADLVVRQTLEGAA
ncbi:DUF1616 domain-containing protein [Halococcoides cellulosivorans]|uniref:DUF1616 domain-containing protein n=1 Tax=Halococcoides cellulosivorans TaxID=1679096 RepID=A0A2R4X3J2_9EURY|nr:DUF1616 domain-containing protein [Halococcoides cellulosivorans]AWB28358.1 hypothetical protein HARCEL1_11890 [Halococcoides cellulosivorans]